MKLIKTLLGVAIVASGFFAFAHQEQSSVDKFHDQMISPIGDGDAPDAASAVTKYHNQIISPIGDGDAPDAPMRYLLGVTRKNT